MLALHHEKVFFTLTVSNSYDARSTCLVCGLHTGSGERPIVFHVQGLEFYHVLPLLFGECLPVFLPKVLLFDLPGAANIMVDYRTHIALHLGCSSQLDLNAIETRSDGVLHSIPASGSALAITKKCRWLTTSEPDNGHQSLYITIGVIQGSMGVSQN